MEKVEEHSIVDIEIEKSNLEVLKESYKIIQENFSLPTFEELNEDFQIEKIQENETEFLVREVRKYIAEKFSGYLRLIETLIQPSNAQMFVFYMVKSISNEDFSILQDIYKKLAKKEIEIIELDVLYNLDKEVEFIKSSYSLWQETKIKLLKIIEKMKINFEENFKESKKDRNYFG